MFGRNGCDVSAFRNAVLAALIVAPAMTAGGCTRQEMALLNSSGPVPKTPQEVLEAEGCKVDVTEAEALAFSDQLLAALAERRLNDVQEMSDFRVLVKIATRGTSNRQAAELFEKGFLSNLPVNKGGIFEGPLSQNAAFRRMRIRGNSRGRNVLIRVLAAEGGVNYIDLAIVRGKSGKPVIVDAYINSIGENFSDTVRRVFLLNGGDPKAALTVKASDADALAGSKIMEQMGENVRAGRHAEVLANYGKMPEVFRRERIILSMRMQSAMQVSEAEYRRSMADIRKYHGEADWTNLILLDDDLLREDYESALRRIDRIEREVGGDPSLDVLRGGVYSGMEDYAAALAAAERCVKAEPELLLGHQAVLNCANLADRYDLMRRELLVLEKQFREEVDALVDGEAFEGFRQSAEFERWKADRKQL